MISLEDFQKIDGIYFPKAVNPQYTDSKALWENVAEGWKKSGYGSQKPSGIWSRIPANQHFETIVDLGCGYGRHGMYLNQDRGINCDRYYGIDVSEIMLRRLLQCKADNDFFATAEMNIICMPLEDLPIPTNSVDFVLSSSVFMHLNEEDIRKTLSEVCRILKTGGCFMFNDSFHNKNCPSHKILKVLKRGKTKEVKSMYLKQYTLKEIETMFVNSKIPEKSSDYTIAPSQYAVVPPQFQRLIPGMKALNERLIQGASPQTKQEVYASAYSVYSNNLFI